MITILTAVMLAMSAGVVAAEGSDPLDPSDGGADWDGDGLTNAEEQQHGTDMTKADSDQDGLPDGWEVAHGLDPNNGGDANADPDGDGLTNAQEYARGTNPNSADTDGDGRPDGSDPFPNDPNDGEYSDSDGDGIPDAYDPDYQESETGSGEGLLYSSITAAISSSGLLSPIILLMIPNNSSLISATGSTSGSASGAGVDSSSASFSCCKA